MQFGPDAVPVSTQSVVIGPPVLSPAPVPVTTTVTVIEPPIFEPSVTPPPSGNVLVDQTYVVSVSDEGTLVTNKVTSMNFVGNAVAVTASGGDVTITVNNDGGIGTIAAGTGIAVVTDNNTATVTNTGVLAVAAGTGISVATANGNATVTNTFTEIVYTGGSVSGTLTPNRNNGTIQKFTLTGNITLALPTNMTAGQSLTLVLTQDNPGNRDLTANAGYLFAGGFNTLSNGAGEIDMLNIFYDGVVYYVTLTVGYSNA